MNRMLATSKQFLLPNLIDSAPSFEALFRIRNAIRGFAGRVEFDLTHTHFVGPGCVALLGGIARSVQGRGGSVDFNWPSAQATVRRHLSTNGFRQALERHPTEIGTHCIPYREFPAHSSRAMPAIMSYLETEWLERGWVNVSDEQRSHVLGSMWEIFTNALEHSGSRSGVIACGHHQALRGELQLCVVDLGFGIAANVREYLENHELPAESALKWAFVRGNTTSRKGFGRGLGLEILRDFVTIKRGSLKIYSNDGYALVDRAGVSFQCRNGAAFRGTLVNVRLTCDGF